MSIQFNNTNATLINLIDIFHEISKGHSMINSFGEGAEYDINATTVENYPLLWVIPEPSKLNDGWTTFNFKVIYCDLVFADQRNEVEVQSNAISVLRDVMYILRDSYDFQIEFGFQVTPFTEKYSDRVAGWYIDCSIDVPQSWGVCDFPFNKC